MKNFKQYLEEAIRSEVNTDPHILSGLMGISQERYTPGIARRVITALGGSPISAANAKKVAAANKAGEDKTKADRAQADADVLRYKKRAAIQEIGEMMKDPNPRPIDSSRYGGRPTSPPITGRPPIDPKFIPKPGQRPSKIRGGNPNKPDKGGNHPMYEDSGERAGSPEDGNTGYGLPRKNSRFYPAKNPRPTGPGTEYHMETLRQKYEAKKAAEAAAAAAEAAKSAGEQEPEHWRDFPTDVRYDQYGDQD